ncbi:MAG: MFS transporter [Hyphomicrobiales bacterium]|nr:MAG: MFS transporter [Hyphomicrobiales bacterium]
MGGSFMQTILIPIQGELPRLLDAPPNDTAWVITATLLSASVCTPIAGKLGDMFGKRRIAILLTILLIIGSLLCLFSNGLPMLIVGRLFQGAGAGVIPLGISLLRDVLDGRRLPSAIALVSGTLGIGGAIGLPLSAFVTENFDWHVLFILSAGISTLSLLFLMLIVPKTSGRGSGGRVDFLGAIGLAIGLVGVLLAISQGNRWGWTSTATLTSIAVGVVAFAIWGWYELRVGNPLVDLRVSVRPAVLLTNLASVAMGFALFSSSVSFPQLLGLPVDRGGLGIDLLRASLMLMPSGIAMLIMSPVAGRIARRVGSRALLIAGACVLALAYALCIALPLNMWLIATINCIIGIGIGLGYAAMPSLIMAVVPRHETAAANGLNALMRSLGTTSAAAVVGAILASTAAADQSGSFTMVFVLGLIAAILCASIAFFIPAPAEARA